ncbi:MAG: hypothetical protein ACYCRH_11850 [Acidiferrobacteraceae bacterium]
MTRTCAKCTYPLPPLPSGLRLLRRQASVSEWKQHVTTPTEQRSWRTCPQCHAVLRRQTTWLGYLLLVVAVVAMWVTVVAFWTRFPLHSLESELAPIPAVLILILVLLGATEWGYTWKLGKSEAQVNTMRPSTRPPPVRDWIDRGLTGASYLCVTLALASLALLYWDDASGPVAFRGHGLLDYSDSVPFVWYLSAITAVGFRQKRRYRALRARNQPDPLELPAWGLAWLVILTDLLAFDAYTPLHGVSWFEPIEMGFGVLGLLALMIRRQRIRRTRGIPTPDRERRGWVPWALIAASGLVVNTLLALWVHTHLPAAAAHCQRRP